MAREDEKFLIKTVFEKFCMEEFVPLRDETREAVMKLEKELNDLKEDRSFVFSLYRSMRAKLVDYEERLLVAESMLKELRE